MFRKTFASVKVRFPPDLKKAKLSDSPLHAMPMEHSAHVQPRSYSSVVQRTDSSSVHTVKRAPDKMAAPIPTAKRPLFNELDGPPAWFEHFVENLALS